MKKSSLLITNDADKLYLKSFPEYNDELNSVNKIIQKTIREICKSVKIPVNWRGTGFLLNNDFENQEKESEQMELLIDTNDYLLNLIVFKII